MARSKKPKKRVAKKVKPSRHRHGHAPAKRRIKAARRVSRGGSRAGRRRPKAQRQPSRKRTRKPSADEVMALPSVLSLLQKGGQTGFVTEEEILHALPEVEENIEALEVVYAELENRGVRVEEP